MTAEYHGPFVDKYYKITVDGYEVPNIAARKSRLQTDKWELLLDGRFSITVQEKDMQQWLWFLANAMAISAGYTCHGEQSCIANPFKKQLIGLSGAEFDDIKGGENV